MRILSLVFASLFVLSSVAQAKPTQKCNTGDSNSVLLGGLSPQEKARIAAAVALPQTDPDLYARLWEPLDAQSSTSVALYFNQFQNIAEIIAAVRADPVIAAMGLSYIHANSRVCLSALPPPGFQRVTEYYNTALKHYFLSSSAAENASIDSGGAGPGWVKTGESFQTIHPFGCYGTNPVFRFYGPGPNSHFYTLDPTECGGLRTQKSGWDPEGVAFGANLPENGVCRIGTPVYRLYNNRWMFNDSNHRYTIKTDIYQQMISQGWIGEGVALCVRDGK